MLKQAKVQWGKMGVKKSPKTNSLHCDLIDTPKTVIMVADKRPTALTAALSPDTTQREESKHNGDKEMADCTN